jgi:hypothetical protein
MTSPIRSDRKHGLARYKKISKRSHLIPKLGFYKHGTRNSREHMVNKEIVLCTAIDGGHLQVIL